MSTNYMPPPGVRAPLFDPGELVLKYLFGVVLADGTQIFQTPEDVSASVAGKNAVYDLLEHDELGNCLQHPLDNHLIMRSDIVIFCLQANGARYVLDLRDAHFEVQHSIKGKYTGAHFYLGFPPPGEKIRPFYFRRRRHHSVLTGTIQEDKSIKVKDLVETSQECEYHFGWETEDKKHRAELILV